MMFAVPRPIANLPWVMLLSVMLIGGVGLLTLYSTAGGSLDPWALRQGMIFAVVFAAALVSRLFPENFIKSLTPIAYVGVLLLLVLVSVEEVLLLEGEQEPLVVHAQRVARRSAAVGNPERLHDLLPYLLVCHHLKTYQ